MAKVLVTESNLTDIGDAIRDRLQVGTQYLPSEMGDAVRSIRVIDVDPTLTQSGYAADAKVVGDRFDNLLDRSLSQRDCAAEARATGEAIADVQKSVDDTVAAVGVELIEDFIGGQYIATNVNVGETVAISSPQTSSNFAYKIVSCAAGDKITLNATGGNAGRLWAFLDSSNALLSKADANAVASNLVLTAPTYAAKLVLNVNLNATIGANYLGTSVDSRIAGNVDATLSVSGKAADAKVAGNNFKLDRGYLNDISDNTYNLFSPYDIMLGVGASGTSLSTRALSADMYSGDDTRITVQAIALPSNLKYEIDWYETNDPSSHKGHYPSNWITDTNVYTTAGLQSTYKHFRIFFGSVNNQALTYDDFIGLKMQVNVGNKILTYIPHYEAFDRTARNEAQNANDMLDKTIERTNNLFNPDSITLGVGASGTSLSTRALSADMYSGDDTRITVQAIALPSNLKYEIDWYETNDPSSHKGRYPSNWITDTNVYTTAGLQSTYKHFRIFFGSVNNQALTYDDFIGLKMQVNVGNKIYMYKPYYSAFDASVRDEPVKIRVMSYNIGHFCYGAGSSLDDCGLPANLYDEKTANMKAFFAEYQPDILGLNEYYEWLDNAKTHKSDDVIFDNIFPYKYQTAGWNALKSDYIINNLSMGTLGGSGRSYIKADIDINGKKIGVAVVHFGLTAESRQIEIDNLITLMDGYQNAIILGDFNTDTAEDREAVFGAAQTAGYTLCNGGYFGWKNTWRYTNPDRPLDNVLIKGRIKLKNYKVLYDEADLLCSDHLPTYADLVIY